MPTDQALCDQPFAKPPDPQAIRHTNAFTPVRLLNLLGRLGLHLPNDFMCKLRKIPEASEVQETKKDKGTWQVICIFLYFPAVRHFQGDRDTGRAGK